MYLFHLHSAVCRRTVARTAKSSPTVPRVSAERANLLEDVHRASLDFGCQVAGAHKVSEAIVFTLSACRFGASEQPSGRTITWNNRGVAMPPFSNGNQRIVRKSVYLRHIHVA